MWRDDETTLRERHARGGRSLGFAAPAMAADDALNAYRVKPTAENKQELAAAGFDLDRGRPRPLHRDLRHARAGGRAGGDGIAPAAGHGLQEAAAARRGLHRLRRRVRRLDALRRGRRRRRSSTSSSTQRIADEPIAKLESLGKTHLGRDIWAIKITKDAKTTADGSRPAVLYNAQQHAREWLAGETCRRTLDYFVDNYGTDERGHAARRHARAVVLLHLEPGRLRVHVHRRQPAVAQEHGRQRRRRRSLGEAGRRRRSEPQLRHELGPRQRGLVRRSRQRRPTAAPGRTPSPRPRR